jgi:coenzyme F420-reducing hydrogenase delta subunit
MQSNKEPRVAVKINDDYCSGCLICSSVCPYEAIRRDPASGKMLLETDRCEACALCYSACPAEAIEVVYYDMNSLAEYLERAKHEYQSDSLVIMCQGCAPDFSSIERMFGISKFIPLSVPCVGRVPQELFLKAIAAMGIRRIYTLACEEGYCRFEKGNSIAERRILASNLLLEQLGYGKAVIDLKRHSVKVKVDSDKCIACGNCAFYCPYNVAELESGAAEFDLNLCRGCGLCVTLCPALALDLENWEKELISALISRLASEMVEPKILVLRCQWSVFPSLDGEWGPHVRAIDLPCAARVDPLHITEAFRCGIDGILVAACPEEDCRSEKGSKEAKRLVNKLDATLSQIGFDGRLTFCSSSPRYPESFKQELEQFKERIEGHMTGIRQ